MGQVIGLATKVFDSILAVAQKRARAIGMQMREIESGMLLLLSGFLEQI
jgi:hypothetical protein